MRLQRKSIFRTVVFTGSRIKNSLSVFCGIVTFVIFVLILSHISKTDFANRIIDIFMMRSVVHAEITEFFTDSEGRAFTIIDGYTMLVSEHIPAPTPSPKTNEKIESILIPETPKTEERTITVVEEIKNQTGKTPDTNNLINQPLYFEKENSEPEVLIIHTHTTESYFETDRNLDENKNMIAVGKVIKDKLVKSGVKVIHDATVHDYPSYNSSYTRSAATTKKHIETNPNIKIVLDIHRDAVATDNGGKLSLVTNINGEKTAQLMFVVGTDEQLSHENWQENLKLALKLQHKANELYPTLMRPINLREQRFNQQLSSGSIIIEVGSNGNTLEEAKRGAELIADVISAVLLNKE